MHFEYDGIDLSQYVQHLEFDPYEDIDDGFEVPGLEPIDETITFYMDPALLPDVLTKRLHHVEIRIKWPWWRLWRRWKYRDPLVVPNAFIYFEGEG